MKSHRFTGTLILSSQHKWKSSREQTLRYRKVLYDLPESHCCSNFHRTHSLKQFQAHYKCSSCTFPVALMKGNRGTSTSLSPQCLRHKPGHMFHFFNRKSLRSPDKNPPVTYSSRSDKQTSTHLPPAEPEHVRAKSSELINGSNMVLTCRKNFNILVEEARSAVVLQRLNICYLDIVVWLHP